MIVGLTGGIGSGKTEVATVFSQLGALVIDTDELAREVVVPGSQGLQDIARVWPSAVRDDALDRAALARIVFNDSAARNRLNSLLHPRIRKRAQECSRLAAPGQLVVQVIPLLFETGLDKEMDATIVVIAPENIRVARVAKRDGVAKEDVLARMAAQMDPAEAAQRADYILENTGDLTALRQQASNLYSLLMV